MVCACTGRGQVKAGWLHAGTSSSSSSSSHLLPLPLPLLVLSAPPPLHPSVPPGHHDLSASSSAALPVRSLSSQAPTLSFVPPVLGRRVFTANARVSVSACVCGCGLPVCVCVCVVEASFRCCRVETPKWQVCVLGGSEALMVWWLSRRKSQCRRPET